LGLGRNLDGQFGGTRSGEVVQDSIGPIQPLDSILLLRLLVLLLRFVLFCRTVVDVSLRFLSVVVAALLHHPQIVGRPHVPVLRRQRPITAGALFQGATRGDPPRHGYLLLLQVQRQRVAVVERRRGRLLGGLLVLARLGLENERLQHQLPVLLLRRKVAGLRLRPRSRPLLELHLRGRQRQRRLRRLPQYRLRLRVSNSRDLKLPLRLWLRLRLRLWLSLRLRLELRLLLNVL
jgi:hypothetical protein